MRKLTKDLNGLVKISLLCFAFFLLSPSIHVKAMFSDTANQNLGIQLELGTISLDALETKIVESVKFTEGNPVKMASSTLVNKGSLSAKLAYQIDVTKEDGSILPIEELKNTVISIDLGNVANKVDATASTLNSHSFTFVKNSSGSDVVIEPNSVGKVPVNISYKSSVPAKEEKLKIIVTFRLIQSNASNADINMFSDEITLENNVLLVPKVIEEESYWPNKSTFVKAGHERYSYSLEKMKMLFSETTNITNSNKKYIKNLNKAMLYIQLPENEPLTKEITKKDGTKEIKQIFNISQLSTGNDAIKVESIELNKEHHGIIITFKLEEDYSYNSANPDASLTYANKDRYELSLNIEVQKYGMYEAEKYGYYDNSHTYDQFFATRLVLNTDIPDAPKNYAQMSIKLTENEQILSFKRLNYNSAPYVRPEDFKEVQLKNEKVNVEITGNNGKIVSSKVNSNKTFSLWLNSNKKLDETTLNVKITGDTGNTLVISRKLEMQNNAKIMGISSLIEEPLKEETKVQNSTEESQEMLTTKVESSATIVEEPVKEVIEEPVNESQEADEVVDPSSIETTIELNENIPEVTKDDKETIAEKE
ncbi:hypothetical protein [Carnobacterium sp.]|uniref:hypothetical protein n=1 Tax=Carnobacterium sp. TaxID=48221 RepID=UPI00388DB793